MKTTKEERRLIKVWSTRDGFIWFAQSRFYMPQDKRRRKVIYEVHDFLYRSHKSMKTTFKNVEKSYYWLFMKNDINQYVRSCLMY